MAAISSRPTSVPVSAWPNPDRLAWQRASAPCIDLFSDRPRVASWAYRTRQGAQAALGRFIGFLAGGAPLAPDGSVTSLVTSDSLIAFIEHERRRKKSRSIKVDIVQIMGALEALAPDHDWSWTRTICRRLAAYASREPPEPRPVVHGRRLYELGVEMMRRSSMEGMPADHRRFRDGLMIALLISAPMRIGNLGAIRIDQHLRKEGDQWSISFAGPETKTCMADSWPLGAELARYLEHYLAVVRPGLLAVSSRPKPTDRLWIGDHGRAIGEQVVRRLIVRATKSAFGTGVLPHSFRHCAATTYSLERPSRSVQASALLGHASGATTEKHYIVQQSHVAQAEAVRLIRKRRAECLVSHHNSILEERPC